MQPGKVNFQEFYFWYVFKHQLAAGEVVRLKGKFMKKVQKWHKSSSKKFSGILEKKYEGGKNEFGLQVNIGQFSKPKYEIGVEARCGLEHKAFVPTLLKHFPPVDDHVVQFIYSVNSGNPALVRERLEEFVTNSMELAAAMLPEDKQPLVNFTYMIY